MHQCLTFTVSYSVLWMLCVLQPVKGNNTSITSCDGYIDPLSGACYELHDDVPLTWQNASAACVGEGRNSHLAWITDNYDRGVLRSFLANRSTTSRLWLGGQLETLYANGILWRWSRDKSVLAAQGCYKDQEATHDLPFEVTGKIAHVTINTCLSTCLAAGYLFAGVQNGSQCFCGNLYGRFGSINTLYEVDNCNTPCVGNTSEMCGSVRQNFIYNVTGVYSIWGFVRPNNWFGYQTCAILSPAVSYKLDDEDCGKPAFAYICDIPRTWCTDGAQLLNGACYFFSSSSTKTTWFIARMDCLARGGDLVKITSSAVWDILKSAVASSGVGYWVGLAGNYWYWSNGAEITYFDWYSRSADIGNFQPSTKSNRCLMLDPQSGYQWIDGNCDEAHSYICVRVPSDVSKVTDSKSSATNSPATERKTGLNATGIALIAVCCALAAAVCAVGIMFYFYWKRQRLNQIHSSYSPGEEKSNENMSPDLCNSRDNLHQNKADDTDGQQQAAVIASPPWPSTFDFWNQRGH